MNDCKIPKYLKKKKHLVHLNMLNVGSYYLYA